METATNPFSNGRIEKPGIEHRYRTKSGGALKSTRFEERSSSGRAGTLLRKRIGRSCQDFSMTAVVSLRCGSEIER